MNAKGLRWNVQRSADFVDRVVNRLRGPLSMMMLGTDTAQALWTLTGFGGIDQIALLADTLI